MSRWTHLELDTVPCAVCGQFFVGALDASPSETIKDNIEIGDALAVYDTLKRRLRFTKYADLIDIGKREVIWVD